MRETGFVEKGNTTIITIGEADILILSCCHCGLTHNFKFEKDELFVVMKIRLNSRDTKKQRKKMIRKGVGLFGPFEKYVELAKAAKAALPTVKGIITDLK